MPIALFDWEAFGARAHRLLELRKSAPPLADTARPQEVLLSVACHLRACMWCSGLNGRSLAGAFNQNLQSCSDEKPCQQHLQEPSTEQL